MDTESGNQNFQTRAEYQAVKQELDTFLNEQGPYGKGTAAVKDFYELQLARQDHPKDQPMGALEAAWTVNCTSRAHENGTYDKGINLAENIFLGTE